MSLISNAAVRMLIVQDDPHMAVKLKTYFEGERYEVTLANDGEEALAWMSGDPQFDIVLLDSLLRKKDGFEVLTAVHAMGFRAPVLMLAPSGEHESIIRGLDLGADDCLTKPCSMRLVAAHVNAILRRTSRRAGGTITDHRVRQQELNALRN